LKQQGAMVDDNDVKLNVEIPVGDGLPNAILRQQSR